MAVYNSLTYARSLYYCIRLRRTAFRRFVLSLVGICFLSACVETEASPFRASDPPPEPNDYNAYYSAVASQLPDRPAALNVPFVRRDRPIHRDDVLALPTLLSISDAAKSAVGPPQKRDTPDTVARAYLRLLAPIYRQSALSVERAKLHSVHDTGRGPIAVSYRAEVDGIPVFRQKMTLLLRRDLSPASISGFLTPHLDATRSPRFLLSFEAALSRALEDLTGEHIPENRIAQIDQKGRFHFLAIGLSSPDSPPSPVENPVQMHRVLFQLPKELTPAYYLVLRLSLPESNEQRVFGTVISATDGTVLYRENLVSDFAYRVWADPNAAGLPHPNPYGSFGTPHPSGNAFDGNEPPLTEAARIEMVHGPISTGDPWLRENAAETVGNNVDAYADLAGGDGFQPEAGDFRAETTAPGEFDHPFDASQDPAASRSQQSAAVTQLFYTVNFLHDWFYDNGFDEAAGNAQYKNFGKGGEEGDPLLAEAQDSSGINNANMSTPPDGYSPKMQQYIFSAVEYRTVTVLSPEEIAGEYKAGIASFGPTRYDTVLELAAYGDATDGTNKGCTAPSKEYNIKEKAAVVYRGGCLFIGKTRNAQAAGAAATVVVNTPGFSLFTMSGEDETIKIPTILVDAALGDAFERMRKKGIPVIARIHREEDTAVRRDAALDNGIVAHEWGHFLHHRLTHSSSRQSRAISEGWGDFLSQLLTVREGDDAVPGNERFSGAYPAVSGYIRRNGYFGARRYPFSTDMERFNPLSFRHIQDGEPLPKGPPVDPGGSPNSEVHNAGEVWATLMWELYASLLTRFDLTFQEAQERMKDYVVAGMKMTPADATFTESRDALLAVAAATDPTDFKRFADAFAKRGLGKDAVSPPRFSADFTGLKESFTSAAAPGALSLGDVTLTDLASCDDDGVLDIGETALLTVRIENSGETPLRRIDVQVDTDESAALSGEGILTLPRTEPGASSKGLLSVTLNGPLDQPELPLRISFGAAEDGVPQKTETVVFPVENGDRGGDGALTLPENEDDTPCDPPSGISLAAESTRTTWENGAGVSISIHLTAPIQHDLDVALSVSDPSEGAVSPETIRFTPENWFRPQTIRVSGTDDDAVDGNVDYLLVARSIRSVTLPEDIDISAEMSLTNMDDDRRCPSGTDASSIRDTAVIGGSVAISLSAAGAQAWEVVYGPNDESGTVSVLSAGDSTHFQLENVSAHYPFVTVRALGVDEDQTPCFDETQLPLTFEPAEVISAGAVPDTEMLPVPFGSLVTIFVQTMGAAAVYADGNPMTPEDPLLPRYNTWTLPHRVTGRGPMVISVLTPGTETPIPAENIHFQTEPGICPSEVSRSTFASAATVGAPVTLNLRAADASGFEIQYAGASERVFDGNAYTIPSVRGDHPAAIVRALGAGPDGHPCADEAELLLPFSAPIVGAPVSLPDVHATKIHEGTRLLITTETEGAVSATLNGIPMGPLLDPHTHHNNVWHLWYEARHTETLTVSAVSPSGETKVGQSLPMEVFPPGCPAEVTVSFGDEPATLGGTAAVRCQARNGDRFEVEYNGVVSAAAPIQERLVDQTETPSGESLMAQTTNDFDGAFTTRIADDFVIPEGETWQVEALHFLGDESGKTPLLNVTIHRNDAGDRPGTSITHYSALETDDASGDLTVKLAGDTEPLLLGPGSYWVSLTAPKSYEESGMWVARLSHNESGASAVWQNPLNGWETGCTDWSPLRDCRKSASGLAFAMLGRRIDSGPRPHRARIEKIRGDEPYVQVRAYGQDTDGAPCEKEVTVAIPFEKAASTALTQHPDTAPNGVTAGTDVSLRVDTLGATAVSVGETSLTPQFPPNTHRTNSWSGSVTAAASTQYLPVLLTTPGAPPGVSYDGIVAVHAVCETRACPPPAPCMEAGTCNPTTGRCEYLPTPDGSPCGTGDGCYGGSCIDLPEGDTCEGALPIEPDRTVTGSFSKLLPHRKVQDNCIPGGLDGRDIFFSVPVEAGEQFAVETWSEHGDLAVSLLFDCTAVNCPETRNLGNRGDAEFLLFTPDRSGFALVQLIDVTPADENEPDQPDIDYTLTVHRRVDVSDPSDTETDESIDPQGGASNVDVDMDTDGATDSAGDTDGPGGDDVDPFDTSDGFTDSTPPADTDTETDRGKGATPTSIRDTMKDLPGHRKDLPDRENASSMNDSARPVDLPRSETETDADSDAGTEYTEGECACTVPGARTRRNPVMMLLEYLFRSPQAFNSP